MHPETETVPRTQRPAETKVRFAGIDIVKIVALILVVTVHAFLHTGFYSTPISFSFGAFQMIFRWIAFCCVPLFMTVTGYLMKKIVYGNKCPICNHNVEDNEIL